MVTIDARMALGGGIGTYVRELVPRVVDARPDWRFNVLVPPGEWSTAAWSRRPNLRTRSATAPIYSAREQVETLALTPRSTGVFWTPHYNVPVMTGAALVVTIHDVMHVALPEYASHPAKRLYARAMHEVVRRRAKAILFDSDFSRGEFRRLVGEPRSLTRVVPLGVNGDWHTVPPDAGGAHPRPYMVYVGFIKPHKNVAALLRAFGRVAAEIPHDLVVVGRREGLRTGDPAVAAEAEKLGPRVVFTGEISADELRRWVRGADLLVQPSLYEGFGLPPLEAMAVGCPCLVARAGSLPEVCGDAALYCDPRSESDIAAGMVQLVRDAPLRDRLRTLGRAHVKSFTWERSAAATLQVLDDVVTAEYS